MFLILTTSPHDLFETAVEDKIYGLKPVVITSNHQRIKVVLLLCFPAKNF